MGQKAAPQGTGPRAMFSGGRLVRCRSSTQTVQLWWQASLQDAGAFGAVTQR